MKKLFSKSGPEQVDVAFGLFTAAIVKLEDAKEACLGEAVDYKIESARLEVKANESAQAAVKANTAIANLKTLIGE
jgi:hypothetical protein